jgi:hypothetical protein
MYTPKYMNILRKRANIPRVLEINGEHRLLVLPGEDKEITTTSGKSLVVTERCLSLNMHCLKLR